MVRTVPHRTLDEVYDPEIRPSALGWEWRVRYRVDGDSLPVDVRGWRPTRTWAERAARSFARALRTEGVPVRWERIAP